MFLFRDVILIQLHFLYNTRWFKLWFLKECHHSLHNGHFPCFLRNPFWQQQTTEVNNDMLILKHFFLQKRQNNWEKLITRFHGKYLAAILKNPYYTPPPPCNTTHIITPSCNTDQVITPLGDITCCISDLSHIQN